MKFEVLNQDIAQERNYFDQKKSNFFNPPSNLIIYLPNIASSIGHFRLLQFGKLFLGISQALFLQNLS